MKIRPPIKCHGGKWFLAKWIISHFPKDYQNMTYVEPYCGGANVLLQKHPARGWRWSTQPKQEIIGDVDPGVVCVLRMIRDLPIIVVSRLRELPYSKKTFETALEKAKYPKHELDYAVNEIVLRRMSRGGLKQAFAWSERQRGGQPGDTNAWQTFIDQVPTISERLESVKILNEPALNLVEWFDDKNVLMYCDPPYLQQTRQAKRVYVNEMTQQGHEALAERLNKAKCKVLLSGYPSDSYEEWYSDWTMKKKQIANHASQQKKKQYKTECLWMNFTPSP